MAKCAATKFDRDTVSAWIAIVRSFIISCMASNATDRQPRRAPPTSARNTGTTESAGRSVRRASNRPPARPFFSVPSSSATRQSPPTISKSKPATPPASSSVHGAPATTSEVRDELVRALMPELRALTEQLVKTTVERSIASLLDRQRVLEAKLERSDRPAFDKSHDFEAKIAAAIAPLIAKQSEFEKVLGTSRPNVGELLASTAPARVEEQVATRRVGPPPLPNQALAVPSIAAERSPMGPRPDEFARAALSENALVDIPAELNGSRRKRVVVFLLVVVLVGILATAAGLSVMSNMGAYP